jgi:hypothetical protein
MNEWKLDVSGFSVPVLSLHCPQIFRDLWAMQAVAVEFPGCAENSTAFRREEF